MTFSVVLTNQDTGEDLVAFGRLFDSESDAHDFGVKAVQKFSVTAGPKDLTVDEFGFKVLSASYTLDDALTEYLQTLNSGA